MLCSGIVCLIAELALHPRKALQSPRYALYNAFYRAFSSRYPLSFPFPFFALLQLIPVEKSAQRKAAGCEARLQLGESSKGRGRHPSRPWGQTRPLPPRPSSGPCDTCRRGSNRPLMIWPVKNETGLCVSCPGLIKANQESKAN